MKKIIGKLLNFEFFFNFPLTTSLIPASTRRPPTILRGSSSFFCEHNPAVQKSHPLMHVEHGAPLSYNVGVKTTGA